MAHFLSNRCRFTFLSKHRTVVLAIFVELNVNFLGKVEVYSSLLVYVIIVLSRLQALSPINILQN